jgi:hypothetical protein
MATGTEPFRCLSSSHVVWDGSALLLAQPCGCALRLLLSEPQAEQMEGWMPKLHGCTLPPAERVCARHGGKA